jgi:hypothetical protein
MPICCLSQSTRLFWMSSISPRRQHNSSAPMIRSRIIGPAYRCSHVFMASAAANSRLSSSLEMRRSRIVSCFLFNRTPNRWNGDFSMSGGVWA